MSKELKYPQIKEIFRKMPLDEFMSKNVSKIPKNIPENIKKKLLEDAKFFSELGITTDDPEKYLAMLQQKTNKKANDKVVQAYPNYDEYMYFQPPRNTQKWVQAVKDMYYRIHKGSDGSEALNHVMSGWDNMEKLDFQNWLKFYEEGAHKKYAQVNYWEDANRAGYFVPIYPEPIKPPATNNAQDIDFAKDPETHPSVSAEEKRHIIEKQRQKIIGRLDSAEKLLRSHEGQTFAGKEFETLLEAIYQLKKKIQMVNKISISVKLYEDMIIRESNVLVRQGFVKAANLLVKIAQQGMPAPPEPPNPVANVGQPGNKPGEGPGLTPPGLGPTDTSAPTDPTTEAAPLDTGKPSPGMEEFLEGLDTGNDTFDEEDEKLEVMDTDDLVVITAQEAPMPPPMPAPDLEVSEDQIKDDPEAKAGRDFDKVIDSAFANITIKDVVDKLEDVSKIFKVREIPRQLSIIDMMLDHLNMASLFPTLSEAINKSLESNQYISTRIDNILSQLRGTLDTKNLDLKGESPTVNNPGVQSAKEKIEGDVEKEKARKQMRKNLENEALMDQGKPKPEIEVEEDLSQPAALQGAPPAALPPPAPPIPPPPR
jgi:hypothetical protein